MAAPADVRAGVHVTHAHQQSPLSACPVAWGKDATAMHVSSPSVSSAFARSFDSWHLLSSPGRILGLHVNPTPPE